MAGGKCPGYGSAYLRAGQMESRDFQRVHELHVVADDGVYAPRIVARHRRGLSISTHVGAHDPEAPRELRHPAVPGEAAFGIAVQQQYGFRLGPWVGKVIDHVMHVQVGRDT